MSQYESITKEDIVRKLHSECGLSFSDANRVHDCFVSLVEESVVRVKKLHLGHVGIITPRIARSRQVSMNFSRRGGRVEKSQRYFYLDERVAFRLKLYKSFSNAIDYNYSKPS